MPYRTRLRDSDDSPEEVKVELLGLRHLLEQGVLLTLQVHELMDVLQENGSDWLTYGTAAE